MPQQAHRIRQIIDSLCQREKGVVYQNPNVRDDCIGTKNSIFDLSSSHLIDRPGILNGMVKNAEIVFVLLKETESNILLFFWWHL